MLVLGSLYLFVDWLSFLLSRKRDSPCISTSVCPWFSCYYLKINKLVCSNWSNKKQKKTLHSIYRGSNMGYINIHMLHSIAITISHCHQQTLENLLKNLILSFFFWKLGAWRGWALAHYARFGIDFSRLDEYVY